MDAEYYAMHEGAKDIQWLKTLCEELGIQYEVPLLPIDQYGSDLSQLWAGSSALHVSTKVLDHQLGIATDHDLRDPQVLHKLEHELDT